MLESLIRAVLKQRLVIVVIAVILLAFGLDATRKLSVDAFPDVTNVQVQIATEALGRSPEEMERFVTVPLEMAMNGLPGLEEMRSSNLPGISLITLVFSDATDVYFARQLVLERLIQVGSRMPQGVTPTLAPLSTGLGEVYLYTLERPDDGGRALTVAELTQRRTVQDWVVRPLLRGIPGVAEINSRGGYVKQYQVLVNPDRMRHYKITLQDVMQALARNNANAGGGVLQHYAEQYLIRGIGMVKGLDDIRSIVLKEQGGVPVFVRDVAEVSIGHDVRYGVLVKNGVTESAGGLVMMISGGNAKEIVGHIKERVAEINAKGMLPDGLQIMPYYDRSELVDAAIDTVVKVLVEGMFLVIVVLFLFLGDVRSSLIVVASLILTPLITFIVMNHYGLSANLMSLGGLAIATGLIVDGSVVVVENTFQRLAENKELSRLRVVLDAAAEVATPVVFGVSIIILVFMPLMTLQGMEGKMFAPLAYTIAIALFVSLVLSLVLTPVLCSYLLVAKHEHDTRLVALVKKPYLRLLAWSLANGRKTILAATGSFVFALLLLPFLGTTFIPEMKEGSIVPVITRVPNISLQEAIKIEMEAMRLVMQVPGVKSAVSSVGRGESPADPQGQNSSTPIVSLKPRSEWPKGWTQDDIAEGIRAKLIKLPGIELVMVQPISALVAEMVSGVSSDVAIKMFGDDMDMLKQKADDIAKVAASVKGAQDLNVEHVTGQQYLSIEIDRQAIARHGLNVADINEVIEAAIGGKTATEIYEGERRFSLAVRLPEIFRNDVASIRNLLITSPNGAQVALQSLAHITVVDGPVQISREKGKRFIVVGLNVKDRDLGSFVAELQSAVERKVKLPEGYYLEWGGQFQNMERAMGHLAFIVPVTIAGIFFLLFLLFGSLRYASLIILVLPFASIGGVVALFITGEYLSVPASVGFIALWGIAVLNGVVLVAYIRSLREAGMSQAEAVLQGCRQRFRPVLMTATVAMLGLIPMLLASGPGSEVQRPLAIVVIGGLISSTLLTLVVLPTLYKWFEEKPVEV